MTFLYKPLGLLIGILSGMIATAAFERVWRLASGGQQKPDATDPNSTWTEIALAAALQGAIFAGVKAITNRAGAKGYEKATGTWPA
ncbi:uncharacterized protein DUF4235 [Jatrophihabitans sp. GAS493]|uniref:DUF4235 domain-containing protein n=1 Tax=Jatrophihabitans sp. GAS493 TaxID=1907575 RepID=UPI000BB6F8C9|nr:DUF4235 domain-containing protein [Jatrophihabitans sp. GAS493]SOD74930.1 uncharacterized protein DUF4235 [Jatrophihabitans sp. GAS493]